eukprot:1087745-Heterocapsa_arctica.AAC.1
MDMVGIGKSICISSVAVWLKQVKSLLEANQQMEAAPWRDGEDRKERGGYPPYRQEDPPWQVKPQITCCRTC